MKRRIVYLMSLSLMVAGLTACQVVEGIFKAGMAWGIFLVFGVVGLIIWLITRGRSK